MTTVLSKERLQQGINDLSDEAAGVIGIVVIKPTDALDIMVDALDGSDQAARLFQAINLLCEEISSAPKRAPVLCVSCPRPLRGSSYSFVVALPHRDAPSKLLGMGVCPQCAIGRRDIAEKAIGHLRKIWPDMHAITVTHSSGGRA